MSIGMLRRNNEIYQYYRRIKLAHGEGRNLRDKSDKVILYHIVQRLDGFISADATYTGGFIITPLITFQGNALELNINTSAAGHALVQILDEDGNPIPGFTFNDADPIQGNYINTKVSWNGNTDVSKLAGKPVKFHILMRAAKLYAFQFTSN